MNPSSLQTFTLQLGPQEIETRCADLWHQFRSPSQVLAALVAMQSLFALAPAGHRENAAYREIQAALAHHAEHARAQLIRKNGGRLLDAMKFRDTREITRIHAELSRNGFWQAASEAGDGRAGAERAVDIAWLETWCQDARCRAEAASGFPDALDFRTAGIDAGEYAAMQELLHCQHSL